MSQTYFEGRTRCTPKVRADPFVNIRPAFQSQDRV
jgi:hypothetical protein